MALKNVLSIVVVYLKGEDYVAADKAVKDGLSVPGFAMSEEGKAAFDLLEAYDKGDGPGIQAVAKRQVFTFLNNEVWYFYFYFFFCFNFLYNVSPLLRCVDQLTQNLLHFLR